MDVEACTFLNNLRDVHIVQVERWDCLTEPFSFLLLEGVGASLILHQDLDKHRHRRISYAIDKVQRMVVSYSRACQVYARYATKVYLFHFRSSHCVNYDCMAAAL